MKNFPSTARDSVLRFDKRRKRNPLSRIKKSLEKVFPFQEKQESVPQPNTKGKMHTNRLKAMYLANILISGPIGLANLIAPKTMRRMMGIPAGDPIHYGIASGAIPLAFGLAGVLGLRSPLRLSPVLGLQVIYKSLFLLGTALPLAIKRGIPLYAAPLIGTFVFFLAGNLIARPFPYLLSRTSGK